MKRAARGDSAERDWLLAAVLASLPALALPISNPDLFWHLSAARRILERGAIPDADWLTWTRPGLPWTDFEWLSQLFFSAVHGLAGFPGLWAAKIALLAAAGAALNATLRVRRVGPPLRAAGLAVWAAAMLPRSDVRPELFSLLFFGLLVLLIERKRERLPVPRAEWMLPLFALWTMSHAGFAYGLLLLGFALLDGLPWMYLAWALLGTLAQPFGWNVYGVLMTHWSDLSAVRGLIAEWGPPELSNPWRLPHWVLLAGAAGAWLARRARAPWGASLAVAALGFWATRHGRLGGYFASAAVPFILAAVHAAPRRVTAFPRRAAAGALLLAAALSLWCGSGFGLFRRVFEDRFVPAKAAEFLEREQGTLGGRPLYNPWGWGGYLGWRLYPKYQVFQDGRYIFHDLLGKAAEAVKTPESWSAFLDGFGADIALLENLPLMWPAEKRYPDGTTRPFPRPFYVFFMPRETWALVHWDEKALLFARRAALPPDWLASREYRWLRPNDAAALQEALAAGQVPAAELAAESERHAASR